MTYKTISVSLNEVSRVEPVLTFAADLAQKDRDAHLIGVYVIPAVQIYPNISGTVVPMVIEEYREFFQNQAERVHELFEDITRRMGLRSEWRSVNSASPLISDSIIEHGRESDLIIVSEVGSATEIGIESDFVERVVMASGRPVLVIPKSGVVSPLQGDALIGWNGSREAARAAFDAVPLLKRMDKVTVIWIDPQKVFETPGAVPGAELAVALARHGINAVAEGFPTAGLPEGEALSMRAQDLGASLLVMGAYGHTRLREYVFGGATRFMLKKILIPTLMSH